MNKKNWKRKTAITALLTTLICILLYLALGSPVLTAEQAFRREVSRHLLDPAVILGTESIDCLHYGYNYNTLLVAQTDHGSILYCTRLNYAEELYYRENVNEFTIMALPNGGISWHYNEPRELNIILFDDYPNAVRAELEMIIDIDALIPDGIYYHYQLSAQRQNPGYFRFIHTVYGSDFMDNDNIAMKILTDITSNTNVDEFYYWQCSIPATVRLYDQNDNLIVEKTLDLRSIGVEEHEKHGK